MYFSIVRRRACWASLVKECASLKTTTLKAFFDEESEVFRLFEKGKSIHEFEIDSGLLKEADQGNIDALNRLEERLKERENER